jgi:Tol biopolymer transport system component
MRRGLLAGLLGLAIAALAPSAAAAAGAPGKIAFVSSRNGDDQIFLMNADGSGQTAITPDDTLGDRSPGWSPDGKQLVITSERSGDGNDDLWVINTDGSVVRRLTTTPEDELNADWSPDGTRIVFTRQNTDGDYDLWIMNADGSGQTPLTQTPVSGEGAYGGHFSPDGQWIVFTHDASSDPPGVIKPDGSGQRDLATGFNAYSTDYTADGKRILFWNADDGDREVYSMAADGSDVRNLTNTPSIGGSNDDDNAPGPSWEGLNRIAFLSHRDGSDELYAMNADGSGVVQLTNTTTGANKGPGFQPSVTCRGKLATIVGTDASEALTGGPGPDVISGQGGADQISGVDANDVICGDAGKDKLVGGKGRDQLDGGKGKDKLIGGKGKDTCVGGKGKDSGKSCEKEKKIP